VAKRRASISLQRDAALVARRVILRNEKLVYVLVANKKLDYTNLRSRVAYIGTTKKGGARIAQSVAARSETILRLHGVTAFEARTISCRPRQHVKMWCKLERALLLSFLEIYGEVPRCNVQGKNYTERDEFDYFTKSRLKRVLEDLA